MKYLLTFILFVGLMGCNDKYIDRIDPGPDYSENYKYYPIKDGRIWNYETTLIDSVKGSMETIQERGEYNIDSGRTNYYRYGSFWSYASWYNVDNRLYIGDIVLIDYSQLDCDSDSVFIYSKVNPTYKSTIYQYCGKQFATEAPNFKTVNCIKTIQRNIYTQGSSMVIVRYYGYDVGLVYSKQSSFNADGKFLKSETMKLVSKNF